MRILSMILLLIYQINEYDFAEIYKNDVVQLERDAHHHLPDYSSIEYFKKFTSIKISDYSNSNYKTKNDFDIIEWKSKNEKQILIKRATKCIKTPNGLCLNFIGYKFMENKKPHYYITVESQGLMEYSINKKDYHILHESIIMGLDDVYYKSKTELKLALDN